LFIPKKADLKGASLSKRPENVENKLLRNGSIQIAGREGVDFIRGR
jgi:hypothetical protein